MRNSQKGQTIIEAIIALMTILIILTAISIVVVNGLYNSTYIKNQNEANKYAQQGMEFVRNIQRNDLTLFSTYQNDTLCVDEANGILTRINCLATGVNTGAFYNRTVSIISGVSPCLDTNETKVTVTVTWSSSKCVGTTFCHKSQLVACMPYDLPASRP